MKLSSTPRQQPQRKSPESHVLGLWVNPEARVVLTVRLIDLESEDSSKKRERDVCMYICIYIYTYAHISI